VHVNVNEKWMGKKKKELGERETRLEFAEQATGRFAAGD
jgi:hypothetical protein